MAKRSDLSRDGRTRLDKVVSNDKKIEKLTVSEEPKRVWMRNMYPAASVGIVGLSSGEKYIFEGRGAEVKVREEDVEQLLAKRRGGCCGTAPGRMFVLV